jgi:hypothetical protein
MRSLRVVVTLADLAHLPRPGCSGANRNAFDSMLQDVGLGHWPDDAVEQFLWEHGADSRFLGHYGHLDLVALEWVDEQRTTAELVSATTADDMTWSDTVTASAASQLKYQPRGVQDSWNVNGTWLRPPLFLDGALRNPPQTELHLIEGHTRLGSLRGLLQLGAITEDATHRVLVAVAARPSSYHA